MKTFKTLEQLLKATDYVTAQNVLNGRLYLKDKGYTSVKIDEDLREEICKDISQLFGGRHVTREQMLWTLMYDRPQHWGLDRVILSQYKDNPPRWKYITGQDFIEESKLIRKALA
jgi:hypothetical protein